MGWGAQPSLAPRCRPPPPSLADAPSLLLACRALPLLLAIAPARRAAAAGLLADVAAAERSAAPAALAALGRLAAARADDEGGRLAAATLCSSLDTRPTAAAGVAAPVGAEGGEEEEGEARDAAAAAAAALRAALVAAPRAMLQALVAAIGGRSRSAASGARAAVDALTPERARRASAAPPSLAAALFPAAADRAWMDALEEDVRSGKEPGGRDGADAVARFASALPRARARAPPAAPTAAPAPPANPDAARGVCASLWLAPLPPGLSSAGVVRAVAAAGAAAKAPPPAGAAAGDGGAIVHYADLPTAALALEALAGADVGAGALVPALCDADGGGPAPPPPALWVPRVGKPAEEAAALAALAAAGVSAPARVLRVGGAAPGLILGFPTWPAVAAAVAALAPPASQPAAGSRPPSGQGHGRVLWRGGLAKGGVPVCELVALTSSSPMEPSDWPAVLDVALRADRAHALSGFDPSAHAVVTLALPPAADRSDRARFVEFLNSLAARHRAGVCEAGLGARRVVLVPPSASVAARLAAAWEPAECLFAMVQPAAE